MNKITSFWTCVHLGVAVLAHVARSGQLDSALDERFLRLKNHWFTKICGQVNPSNDILVSKWCMSKTKLHKEIYDLCSNFPDNRVHIYSNYTGWSKKIETVKLCCIHKKWKLCNVQTMHSALVAHQDFYAFLSIDLPLATDKIRTKVKWHFEALI